MCDNKALAAWSGQVAIDCWENEPHLLPELLSKAFVATPHIAGYSIEGKQRGTAMVVQALAQHFGWHIAVPMPSAPAQGASHITLSHIMDSYNPLADTALLKQRPQDFESLRNDYPLRHETTDIIPNP